MSDGSLLESWKETVAQRGARVPHDGTGWQLRVEPAAEPIPCVALPQCPRHSLSGHVIGSSAPSSRRSPDVPGAGTVGHRDKECSSGSQHGDEGTQGTQGTRAVSWEVQEGCLQAVAGALQAGVEPEQSPRRTWHPGYSKPWVITTRGREGTD